MKTAETINELTKLLQTLEDTETFYNLGKYGSVLRKIDESKTRVRRLIEKLEDKT